MIEATLFNGSRIVIVQGWDHTFKGQLFSPDGELVSDLYGYEEQFSLFVDLLDDTNVIQVDVYVPDWSERSRRENIEDMVVLLEDQHGALPYAFLDYLLEQDDVFDSDPASWEALYQRWKENMENE